MKDDERRTLEETIDFLWDPSGETQGSNAVKLTNVIVSRGEGRKSDSEVKLTKILEAYAKRVVNENTRIGAGEVAIHVIDNAAQAIRQRLNRCKPWMSEVEGLCQRAKPGQDDLYIITGIYTCKDLEVSWNKETSGNKGLASEVPGESVAAVASAVSPGVVMPTDVAKVADTSAKFQRIKETERDVSARIPQEIVFAIRYHILELDFESDPPQKPSNFLVRMSHKVAGKQNMSTVHSTRVLKSVSMGLPVRDRDMLGSYGNNENSQFYWIEPRFRHPYRDESDEQYDRAAPDGVAH